MKKYIAVFILVFAGLFTLTAAEGEAFELFPNALGGSGGTGGKVGISYTRWFGDIGVRGTYFNNAGFSQSSSYHHLTINFTLEGLYQLYKYGDNIFGANLYLLAGVSDNFAWATKTGITNGIMVNAGFGTELLFVSHWGLFVEFMQGYSFQTNKTGPNYAIGFNYRF